jgi:hypothetical protein
MGASVQSGMLILLSPLVSLTPKLLYNQENLSQVNTRPRNYFRRCGLPTIPLNSYSSRKKGSGYRPWYFLFFSVGSCFTVVRITTPLVEPSSYNVTSRQANRCEVCAY